MSDEATCALCGKHPLLDREGRMLPHEGLRERLRCLGSRLTPHNACEYARSCAADGDEEVRAILRGLDAAAREPDARWLAVYGAAYVQVFFANWEGHGGDPTLAARQDYAREAEAIADAEQAARGAR